jgi:hypothetical protein
MLGIKVIRYNRKTAIIAGIFPHFAAHLCKIIAMRIKAEIWEILHNNK